MKFTFIKCLFIGLSFMTTTTVLAEKVVSAKDMNIVGDGKTMNTKAIQKAKSKMLPFGWWHMAKALYLKHSTTLDLLLIGTLPEYQDTGCISLIFADMITAAQKRL